MNTFIIKHITEVKAYMIRNRQSLAVAESVTSGNLQAAFSLADHALDFFQGGITAYNLGQKARHLGINPIQAEACNCVSAAIARAMAIRSSELFTSNWGIGITGYAASVPEWKVREPFCYFAISYSGKLIYSRKLISNKPEGIETQYYYVNEVIRSLATLLKKKKP